jgi:hypothetical protein
VLQLLAVVLAHELIFLARYGSRYGEALAHSGHGQAWADAVLTSILLASALAGFAIARLVRLGVLVRRAGASSARPDASSLRSLTATFLHVGPRTAAISVVVLTIQENLERAAMGAGAGGLMILLSPEYAGGLWIAVAVGLLVGLVAALFTWRRRVLLARLRAARAAALARGSRVAVARPRLREILPSGSLLGRNSALRAPPLPGSV